MKTFKKEWNEKDFDLANSSILNYFSYKTLKNQRGENVTMRGILNRLEEQLGLPYTSSSSFACMALDCNSHFYHPTEKDFRFDYVAITEDNKIFIALCDNEDEKEMFIQIN
jgi:hypothetical protein